MAFVLHTVSEITDPRLLPALRIYEQAFPVYEQMTSSFWIRLLLSPNDDAMQFISVVDTESDEVVGMILYQIHRHEQSAPVAVLWYFCTRSDIRNRGSGGEIYQIMVSRLFAEGVRAMVFEVERPDVVIKQSVEGAELAERRIRWYQRNGAKLIKNADYLQYVDNGLPPTPMHLMIHTPSPVTPEEAFQIATEAAGMDATAIGTLELV